MNEFESPHYVMSDPVCLRPGESVGFCELDPSSAGIAVALVKTLNLPEPAMMINREGRIIQSMMVISSWRFGEGFWCWCKLGDSTKELIGAMMITAVECGKLKLGSWYGLVFGKVI